MANSTWRSVAFVCGCGKSVFIQSSGSDGDQDQEVGFRCDVCKTDFIMGIQANQKTPKAPNTIYKKNVSPSRLLRSFKICRYDTTRIPTEP